MIVVPVSGGKDSQACLKLAVAHAGAQNVRGLFCDTQFEHPLTYAHVEKLRHLYGDVRIDTICAGDVLSLCERFGRFPSGVSRHCTDYLKIRPTKRYLKALAEEVGSFEVWYGMRALESRDRSKRYAGKIDSQLYEPHEVMPSKYPKYLGKMGVRFRLPIVDWTHGEVMEAIHGEANPLYAAGFDRVGCFPCLAAGDAYKEQAFAHDEFGDSQKVIVIATAGRIGKSVWTSKSGKARNGFLGCAVCAI